MGKFCAAAAAAGLVMVATVEAVRRGQRTTMLEQAFRAGVECERYRKRHGSECRP